MRKICFVSGSRAEYGLLQGLMEDVRDDYDLDLQLVVTGSHLGKRFGATIKEIENDGFVVDERVEMDLEDDASVAVAQATGQCLIGMAAALGRLRPDILVILGDRFEILAAATAALILRIPLAHIAGGETTEGAMDEAIRHAITKMAHLHFPAADIYRNRILQLGEDPGHVHTVGALGLDALDRLVLLDRHELAASIGIDAEAPFFLITYHPVTLSDADPAAGVEQLLSALELFEGRNLVFTGVNADPGNDRVARAIHAFVARHSDRAVVVTSLGQTRYLSAMKHAEAVLGNSSSGIVEAPAFGVPTVNTGDRQRGRIRAQSVLDCDENRDVIAETIKVAISSTFRDQIRGATYPFGEPGATRRILEHLKRTSLDNVLMKRFHDIGAC
jgi:UDP-hydrolysing UDP-N-acetyl-D-glucosamine 2-epimerase